MRNKKLPKFEHFDDGGYFILDVNKRIAICNKCGKAKVGIDFVEKGGNWPLWKSKTLK